MTACSTDGTYNERMKYVTGGKSLGQIVVENVNLEKAKFDAGPGNDSAVETIKEMNRLPSASVSEGQELFVPPVCETTNDPERIAQLKKEGYFIPSSANENTPKQSISEAQGTNIRIVNGQ